MKRGHFDVVLAIVACLALGLLAGSAVRSHFGGIDFTGGVEPDTARMADDGMAIGPETGVPVLRIFGDYECPACGSLERHAGDTLRALARRGHIRFVYHHSPLRLHHRGRLAAAAVHCASASLRWRVHAALYDGVSHWRTGNDTKDRVLSVLGAVADTGAISQCMGSDAVQHRVAADRALADRLGIVEVPTVFWSGRQLRIRTWHALVRFVSRAAAP